MLLPRPSGHFVSWGYNDIDNLHALMTPFHDDAPDCLLYTHAFRLGLKHSGVHNLLGLRMTNPISAIVIREISHDGFELLHPDANPTSL